MYYNTAICIWPRKLLSCVLSFIRAASTFNGIFFLLEDLLFFFEWPLYNGGSTAVFFFF
ncbi:hypothetical protein MA16_Dca007061 [Dendrobium catenatum]|uniref:Uncharacterized protein n=1 Tax=Dendrobium catenatum TaxID=906689 RepID=A0A2I0W3S9_9ASPA|nr:hypothetical protein MA16_Dca007061 [Dendrobium catenatum]